MQVKNLRKLMKANHVRQRDLAEIMGISEQAVSDKFHNRSRFTLRDISRIADAFDVSVDYLMCRTDSMEVVSHG